MRGQVFTSRGLANVFRHAQMSHGGLNWWRLEGPRWHDKKWG